MAAFEVLVATPAVRAVIREGKMHQLHSTMETAQNVGMVTLDRSLLELARKGAVSLDEAARHMRSPAMLKSLGEG